MHLARLSAILAALCALAAAAAVNQSSGIAASSTPALGSDPAYQAARPAPGDGTGTDSGVYLPPLAGPTSVITGSVVAQDEPGPKAFYVATVDQAGHKTFFKGLTDQSGHFKLKLPEIAGGVAALLLFRHFGKDGAPDSGSTCRVSDAPTHLEDAQALAHVPSSGAAVTEANSAYEIGGQGQGLMQMQIRGLDPGNARVLVDGSAKGVETLAASDRSIVAKLADTAPLGAHRVAVASGDKQTNSFSSVFVAQRFDALAPMKPGSTQPVTLHISGLRPQDAAIVIFNVGGAAQLADGAPTQQVPVRDGKASCEIRAEHPGELIIKTVLDVALADFIPGLAEHAAENIGQTTPAPGGVTREATATPGGSAPSSEPSAYPSPLESPVIYGHEPNVACKVEPLDGWFEPTQAVWQDDRDFPDQKTKQITKSSKFAPVPSYDAELKMVSNRDTVLFGQDYYVEGGSQHNAPGRDVIEIDYKSNCSKTRDVHFVFTLEQTNTTVYADKTKLQAYIVGPPNPNGAYKTYQLKIAVPGGIPPEGTTPFLLDKGGYSFVAEIKSYDDNSSSRQNPSSLRVIVYDEAVETHAPTLHFIPVEWVWKGDTKDYGALETKLKSDTDALAQSSHLAIPDYYPVQNDDMPVAVAEIKKIEYDRTKPSMPSTTYRILKGELGGWWTGYGAMNGATFLINEAREDLLREIIIDDADTKAFTEKAGRAIVVLPNSMWSSLMPASMLGKYSGQKVILVPQNTEHWEVAHEVAHSIPLPGWDGGAANAECQKTYHNLQPTTKSARGTTVYASIGNGERLRTNSERTGRTRMDHDLFYFGASATGLAPENLDWSDQCTYWHLLKNLQPPQDPDILLVRGFLFNRPPSFAAFMGPLYTYSSSVDLDQRSRGSWAIVLRDAHGGALATYRFEPQWKFQDTDIVRDMLHFAYRVRSNPGMASVELDGPRGMIETMRFSAHAPAVTISEPADGSVMPIGPAAVHVAWKASGQKDRVLFSSVLYSSDHGANWLTSEHEVTETAGHAPVYLHQTSLWIKVITTDGTRSAESAVVKLRAP
ncbi:MAG: hypothetical protein JO219_03015 [Candidatus Eremiobacteraeota bacterium]|nr:hypothetical protein [Candidatus Eremiobacteraeota bacterium]MBV8364880.1 hypothetical protein [Candidatus Eremiobacteraeota bacterium]